MYLVHRGACIAASLKLDSSHVPISGFRKARQLPRSDLASGEHPLCLNPIPARLLRRIHPWIRPQQQAINALFDSPAGDPETGSHDTHILHRLAAQRLPQLQGNTECLAASSVLDQVLLDLYRQPKLAAAPVL